MNGKSRYSELGVDVHKAGIDFFKSFVANIFPHAFTNVFKVSEGGRGLVLHVDGAGSKPIIAYLYYKETGDCKWFRGLTQDVVAMNLDDVITVGAKPIAFADYISLNSFKIPRLEVLHELGVGFKEVFDLLSNFNLPILFAGGETADLPDQVRTLDIAGILLAEVELSKAITGDSICAGNIIVGLKSSGRAKYEKVENSGIMCNGLTLARHALLNESYLSKFPEIGEPLSERKYFGRYCLEDYLDELGMTIGEALLSPTRIYAPIIMEVLERCGEGVTGMVHNTGGGLTKILRIGVNLRYIKDNLPPIDPIFKLIQLEGKVNWSEMYEVFNMGIGFEIIVKEEYVDEVVSISEKYGVDAYVIGRVERSSFQSNEVIIKTPEGTFTYRGK